MTVKIITLFTCIISIVNYVECSKIEGFVVGGFLSDIEEFPYSAFVVITCNDRVTTCGASIVNQRLLLTAAHCIHNCLLGPFNIVAFTGSEVKYKGNSTSVISFKVHEGYSSSRSDNDIALMRLANDLTFGPKVQRVVLMKEPPQYKYGVTAGWGWIDSIGTRGDYLKHVRQEFLDAETCKSKLGPVPIPLGTICGRELSGQSYPEKGDSGSALVANSSVQIGIVSFKRRGFSNDTIVYTHIPYYYDWVIDKAAELTCTDNDNTL